MSIGTEVTLPILQWLHIFYSGGFSPWLYPPQLVSTHGSNAVSWLLISLYSTDNLFLCCCYCIACRLWHGRPAAATQTALAWIWWCFWVMLILLYLCITVPCFSNFTAPMGTVLSPDYPEGYGNNLNCVWLIISELGTRIHLAFNDFDLEPPYDFLTIRDGDQSGATLLGRFSGAEVPSHLTSNSNVLQLEFQADHSMSGRGFNITYSSKTHLDLNKKKL